MKQYLVPLCGALPLAAMTAGLAHGDPLSPFLFSDQTADALVLVTDLNGDGDGQDPGEAQVFFDGSNASGLTGAGSNIFTIVQDTDGTVYAGDGDADAVFRLRDNNGNGNAQGRGQANVWFSSNNAEGLTLQTPNGLAVGNDGAVYVVEADTLGNPSGDFVYRTVDLNNDGDAEDIGESSIWLDLSALDPASSAFEIAFDGDTAYISDTAGGSPRIYRASDSDGSGVIEASEVNVFIDGSNPFGVPLDFAFDAFLGDVYSLELFGDSLFRLTDLDGSGDINDPSEAQEVWNASLVPDPFLGSVFFGMAAGPGGDLVLTSSGGDANEDLLIYLRDLNGDGLFTDPDETIVALSGDTNGVFPNRARTAAFYSPVVAPVPLPAALPLMLAGLGLLGLMRRRG